MTPSATYARRGLAVAPGWLRPAALVMVAGLHAGALYALGAYRASGPPALKSVEVTLVAAGDEAPETTAAASAPQPPPDPAPTPQPPAAPPAAPDPQPVAPEASASAASSTDAPRPPRVAEVEPPQALAPAPAPPPPVAEAPAMEPPPLPGPPEKPQEKPPLARPAQASPALTRPKPPRPRPAAVAKLEAPTAARPSEAHQVGLAEGATHDAGLSREAYGAMILAAIQARKYYPEGARERGVAGSVGVAFSVGPSGEMKSVTIVRSSGSPELDEAVRKIVRSVTAPPPPGGAFSASTSIVFRID